MAVRIQLASNFQVIELTYNSWGDVNTDELADAINLANELGSKVKNDIKTAKPVEKKSGKKPGKKPENTSEMASESQIEWLVNLGLTRKEAKAMTKSEAWQYIQDNK